MRTFILAFTCLMSLFLFSATAPAQMMGHGAGPGNMGPGNQGYGGQGYGGPGYGGMGYGNRWNDYQLTPEQQQAYQEITAKYRADFAKLSEQVWSKRATLNALLAQEKIDKTKAKAAAKEIGDIMSRFYALRVDMLIDLREKGLSYYGLEMMHGGMGSGMMDMMHGGGMGYGMMGMPGYGWHGPGQGYGNTPPSQ